MGSHIIQEKFEATKDIESAMEAAKVEVLGLLKQSVRPEFLNRIDELIMFTPLTLDEIKGVVNLQFSLIKKNLESNGIMIQFSDSAATWISKMGYEPQYGARPIKRVLQRFILNELSKKIIAGDVNRDKPIIVDVDNENLFFSN